MIGNDPFCRAPNKVKPSSIVHFHDSKNNLDLLPSMKETLQTRRYNKLQQQQAADTENEKKKRYKSSSKDSFTFEPIGCSYWHLIPIVSDSGRVPPALPPALFPVLSDTAIRLWHSAEESLGLERSKWWFNWPERFESRAVISWITMISFIRWLLDINRFNLYVFFCLFWLQLRTFMCKTWWCTSGNDLRQGYKLHPLNQVFLMTLM